jgi:homogentisate phytyltransferase/homogentisate geranylgeranyltransferase
VNRLSIFIRFCRPHTIIATSLQVSGLFILAYASKPVSIDRLWIWFLALVASLAANIYIVGLNQLTDVVIDRINKPTLPLASGELSIRQGRLIVIAVALASVTVAATQSPILLITVLISMLIGSLYSLPPFHLKSRPLWAALSIAFVRGFVANLGLILHFNQEIGPSSAVSWPLAVGLTAFFFGFGLVIALYKDIPDLIGDKEYDVRTYTVRLGPERVFNAGRLILTATYVIPILAAVTLLPDLSGVVLLAAHLVIVALFWRRSLAVDLARPDDVTRFYMFLWSLFYVEYILLALAALSG